MLRNGVCMNAACAHAYDVASGGALSPRPSKPVAARCSTAGVPRTRCVPSMQMPPPQIGKFSPATPPSQPARMGAQCVHLRVPFDPKQAQSAVSPGRDGARRHGRRRGG
eukprot:212745-Chlamydomonas_euryale.AAC.5